MRKGGVGCKKEGKSTKGRLKFRKLNSTITEGQKFRSRRGRQRRRRDSMTQEERAEERKGGG